MNTLKKFLIIVLLFIIWCLSIYFRYKIFSIRDRKDEFSPIYITEAAIHLRYASMISKYGKLPLIDYNAEYPHGYKIHSRSDTFQEYIVGYLHRLPFFNKIPIHRFTEYTSWFFSSLCGFAAYFLSYLVTGSVWISLVSFLSYAVSVASLLRTVNGMFIREILALPLIFFHLGLLVFYLKKNSLKSLFASLLFTIVIIFSWQMWRFIWLITLGFLVFEWIKNNNLRHKIENIIIFHSIALVLAAFIVPYLRSQGGLAEIPVCITISFALFFLLKKRFSLLLSVTVALVIPVMIFLFFPTTREHNYIFLLLLQKIRFLFSKPSDPSVLSDVVRLLWAGPFESASLYKIFYLIGSYWIWGILFIVIFLPSFFKKKSSVEEDLLFWMILIYSVGFLFVERLSVFLIFFLSIASSVTLFYINKDKLWKKIIVNSFFIIFIILSTIKTARIEYKKQFLGSLLKKINLLEPAMEFLPRKDNIVDLINYIKKNIPSQSSIFARYSISAAILYYTDRPVFLSPLYDRRTAERIIRFTQMLFEPEEKLHSFCIKEKVSFIIHEAATFMLDNVRSDRYMVNRLLINTNETCYLMQYRPERLKYFVLIHQDPFFRIYRHIDGPSVLPDSTVKRKFPLYNESLIKSLNRTQNDIFLAFQEADKLRFEADLFYSARMFDKAFEFYRESFNTFPFYGDVLLNMGRIMLAKKEFDNAAKFFEEAYILDPSPDTTYGVAVSLILKGKFFEAKKKLFDVLKEDPCHTSALSDLIFIYSSEKKKQEAINLAKKMYECGKDRALAEKILKNLQR